MLLAAKDGYFCVKWCCGDSVTESVAGDGVVVLEVLVWCPQKCVLVVVSVEWFWNLLQGILDLEDAMDKIEFFALSRPIQVSYLVKHLMMEGGRDDWV